MRLLLSFFLLCWLTAVSQGAIIGKFTVTAEQASIMLDKDIVQTAKKGSVLDVTEINGDWYGVLPTRGWIQKANGRYELAQPRMAPVAPVAPVAPDASLPRRESRSEFTNTQIGNTPTEAMNKAHAQGAKSGYADGLKDGDAAGFEDVVKPAEHASFNETLSKLYASGNYTRITFYTIVVAAGGFLLGFGLQYVVMLLIRKCGFLHHIDQIILGEYATEVDLNNLALPPVSPKHNGVVNDHRFMLPLFAFFVLLSTGCQNQEKEAWQKAYDANYEAGKQAGQQAGEARGSKIGKEEGAAAAKEAAENGSAWQLYKNIAIGWLILGAVVGLLTQYIVLLACRFSERLQQLFLALSSGDPRQLLECDGPGAYQQLTVACVPAMKASKSYFSFQQSQRFMSEIEKIRALEKLDAAKIHATVLGVEKTLNRAVAGASNIEEFEKVGWDRLLYLAKAELAKISSEAQAKANRLIIQDEHSRGRLLIQPPPSQDTSRSKPRSRE
ncbi:MAG: hypothetical protein IMZ61_02310 [Planctomycetes bacterium]|nr:hypothetical protein [Planctomycetota bacterium]